MNTGLGRVRIRGRPPTLFRWLAEPLRAPNNMRLAEGSEAVNEAREAGVDLEVPSYQETALSWQ